MTAASPLPFFEPEPDGLDDFPDLGDGVSLREALEHHLARLRRYRALHGEIEGDAERMIFRIQAWKDRRAEPLRSRIEFSEGVIRYLVSAEVDQHPNGPKKFDLPSGVARANPARSKVVVDDLDAFKDWVIVREDAEQLSRWKVEPVKEGLKAILANGEIVPGVRLEEGERTVTISLEDDE